MLLKEDILKVTGNGLDVFRHYVKGDWVVKKAFKNPLYNDTNASCFICLNKKRKYVMYDHGNEAYSGDCFDIVGKIVGYDNDTEFDKILQTINRDMSLGLDDTKSSYNSTQHKRKERPLNIIPTANVSKEMPSPAVKKEYSFTTKPFTDADLKFWGSYGISEQMLIKYNVVSIAKFRSTSQNGNCYYLKFSSEELRYGYIGDGYIKLYRPFDAKRFSYGGVVPNPRCFGLSQLPPKGDILFITGGEKDVMSLSARGFSAICFNSETKHPPKSIIGRLTYRFKHIVLLYDMDKTGIEHSTDHVQKLSEYNAMRLELPLKGTKEEKDISDYFRLGYSAKDLRELFAQLLSRKYSNTVSILKSCRVSLELPPPESEVIVSINNVPLGTNGNLLCVTGGEGTGKSNFIGAVIAGALASDNQEIDSLGVTVKGNTTHLPIILYDTEQSETQVFKNSSNIMRRAKCSSVPKEFYPYFFASLSRDVRLQSIIESMDLFHHKWGGIHMVVIDGIADLISGANNEGESIAIVEQLYRLAAIYNTCIICVLHFIPNGLKLRGHLGSELQRKSAAILSIERDSDNSSVSVIKTLKVRDGSPLDIPVIKFAWNKDKNMHCYLGVKRKNEHKKRELQKVAIEIFSHKQSCSASELNEQLQSHFHIKQRAAKGYIDCMIEDKIVMNDPNDADYYVIYKNS